ncbi:hypothetical protein BDB01DRAFT_810277 [Pilobolus umbonatus]|nr:hypothetical protein BDB01DRAFT_810277 [Pilobolus umbonatus]
MGKEKGNVAIDRLNFLHQASLLMSTIQYTPSTTPTITQVPHYKGDPPGTVLGPARYFTHTMQYMSRRLVMRLDPTIKRTQCKRCETPLLPALTSHIRMHCNYSLSYKLFHPC